MNDNYIKYNSSDRDYIRNINASVVRFYDKDFNICKEKDAVHASIDNEFVMLSDAFLLFQKKMLIKKYQELDKNPMLYREFKRLIETKIDMIELSDDEKDYISSIHHTCPDDEYLCLLFFNTVLLDENSYGYKDALDILTEFKNQQVHVHSAFYLKKDLSNKKLQTILYNAKLLGLNVHISVNSFNKPRRTLEYLYSSSAIIIDLDYYHSEYAEITSHSEFVRALKPTFDKIGWPSFVTYSGHGYYLTYILDSNINFKYKEMQWLYTSVVKKLIETFKDFGADNACSDMTRVFKIPGSINFKTENPVKLCYSDFDRKTSISELATVLGITKKTGNSNPSRNKTRLLCSHKSRYSNVNEARLSDYEKLLELRNYKLPHMRDLFFLYVSINCINMGWTSDYTLSYCHKLNSELYHPFPDNELETIVHYLYGLKLDDGTCKVRYTNDHIVSSLEITIEEQKHMKQLISKETRLARKKAWDKEHSKMLVLENKHHQDELVNELLYLRYMEHRTNEEIADSIGIDVRTVAAKIGATPPEIALEQNLLQKEYDFYVLESKYFEVYTLRYEGYTLQQIADYMHLSLRTVKGYSSAIKKSHLRVTA